MAVQEREIQEAIAAFERLNAAVAASTEQQWVHLDLTVTQLTALFMLARSGPTSVGQLAEKLGTRLSSASVLVDRLVNAGLIARSPDPRDRRRVILVVTDTGKDLLRRLRQGSVELRQWLSALTPETLECLTVGLRALAEVASGRVRFSVLTEAMAEPDAPPADVEGRGPEVN